MWGKWNGVVVAAFVASAAACAHPNSVPNGDVAPAAPIGVHVENQNFNDVNVYAISGGGVARRLGTVTGSNSSTFSLSPSYATRELYIVAVPIGGFGRASSGAVNVMPGDTLDFIVGPRLTSSGVFIR